MNIIIQVARHVEDYFHCVEIPVIETHDSVFDGDMYKAHKNLVCLTHKTFIGGLLQMKKNPEWDINISLIIFLSYSSICLILMII